MSGRCCFLRDSAGASAAEFAMILPLALLFLFGIIDVGRYVWTLNELEKAAQMGARYAVATDVVPTGLNAYDTVGFACPGGVLAHGDRICREALGTIRCQPTGGTASCFCAIGPCPDPGAADNTAFANIVGRIRVASGRVGPDNVTVSYSGSGIGFAGDPAVDADGNALSDIAPIVTVEISGVQMRSFSSLVGIPIELPPVRSSLTLEDGLGFKAY